MLKRKIQAEFTSFLQETRKEALLVAGARQVGKTYSIRDFAKSHYADFVEINFIEQPEAKALFDKTRGITDFFNRFSAFVGRSLIAGKTLVFFDEVQECPEIVTFIKFLVDDGRYRYILSGSLLGVEMKDVRSVPVGYLREIHMFPLDFEEFILANGMPKEVVSHLRETFEKGESVDSVVDGKMMELFRLYLVVGGMPAVVQTYVETGDIQAVVREQQAILAQYRKDAAKYDLEHKMAIERVFDLIPSELNAQNKRFYANTLQPGERFTHISDNFVWLQSAGLAIPVYNVDVPKIPLELAKKANRFKLFLNDVGLLSAMYLDGIQFKILSGELSMNAGAVYENFVAQELRAHGFEKLFYYNSKKYGEVDFLIERDGAVFAIEAKSGRDYDVHIALDNMMTEAALGIEKALVLNASADSSQKGNVSYRPIYTTMFIKRNPLPEKLIYKIDLSMLGKR